MPTPSSPLANCGSNAASSSSSPMMSTFRYISSKLAHRNLHLDFILDDSHDSNINQGCILIPLRPLSRSEQSYFTKISTSARTKFPTFHVRARSLDQGALTSSSSSSSSSFSSSSSSSSFPSSPSSASFPQDPQAAAPAVTIQNPTTTTTTTTTTTKPRTKTKHEYIFEVVDPIHLLQQSNIPHHVVFRADGLLVLSIDSFSSFPSNDGEEKQEEDGEEGEEGEEFILHSYSSWSLSGGPGGRGDSPIYGFGLRDYFRNNPRLGRADKATLTATNTATTDNNTDIHESEHGVMSSRTRRSRSRRRRDTDDINKVINNTSRGKVEASLLPPSHVNKGKEAPSSFSSSFLINQNNNNRKKAYQSTSSTSSLPQPQAAASSSSSSSSSFNAPHRNNTITATSSNRSCSNDKTSFGFALSEYPLYRRDSGLGGGGGAYAAAASASIKASALASAAAGRGGGGEYDPLNHLIEGISEGQEDKINCGGGGRGGRGGRGDRGGMSTTMILGSEWETFRRIGLGVGG